MSDRLYRIGKAAFWLAALFSFYIMPAGAAASAPASAPASASAPAPPPVLDGISILKPGDTSQVISPVPVEAEMDVPESGSIRVELVDEEGRIITRKIYAFHACEENLSANKQEAFIIREPISFCGNRRVKMITDLTFGMAVGHQAARLQVSIQDDMQRVRSLNSASLILLESGSVRMVDPVAEEQGIHFTEPADGASISGRLLAIAGEAPPTHILPMRVEVVTFLGKAIGSRMISVGRADDPSGALQKGNFRIEIPYKIKDTQQALITITAADENIPGDRYVASRSVTLLP